MYDLNIKLLCGGYHHCLPEWSAASIFNENYYKLYFPVEGEAELRVDDRIYKLEPGRIYFINGHKLRSQMCASSMKVYWIHFEPCSLVLNKLLNELTAIVSWPLNSELLQEKELRMLPELFDEPFNEKNEVLVSASLGRILAISAQVLSLIADILKANGTRISHAALSEYERLKPAIDYMNQNFQRSVSLEEIASQVFLNPIYFQRLFRKSFGITPAQYMIDKRLSEARILLRRRELTINEISMQLGFCNQFYFSKIFKRLTGKTPSQYRDLMDKP